MHVTKKFINAHWGGHHGAPRMMLTVRAAEFHDGGQAQPFGRLIQVDAILCSHMMHL